LSSVVAIRGQKRARRLRLVPDKITSWDFRKKAAFEGDAFDFG
jgi:hypothetical protein